DIPTTSSPMVGSQCRCSARVEDWRCETALDPCCFKQRRLYSAEIMIAARNKSLFPRLAQRKLDTREPPSICRHNLACPITGSRAAKAEKVPSRVERKC